MWEIEVILLLCIVTLGTIVSVTDIKEGIIKNKVLVVFAIIGLLLDGLYYSIFARDILLDFIVNFSFVVLISLVLYFTHSFAGGDCKYCIVLAILYPANYYLVYGDTVYTLTFTIGIAILYGYIYLLFASVVSIMRKKNSLSKEYIIGYIKSFFYSYISALLYIAFVNLMFAWVSVYFSIEEWVISVICLTVAWVVGKLDFLKKWYLLIGIMIIDLIGTYVLGVIPIPINHRSYIIVFVLLISQMTIRTYLYESIEIKYLTKGMILSMFSTIMMQNSRVRGLPNISSEDLKSRLSQEEVEAVGRWAKSRDVNEVIIVKKIPFALFITMGIITYILIRSI